MSPEQLQVLVKKIRRTPICQADPPNAVSVEGDVVLRLIPHREPFLFVKRIVQVDLTTETLRGEWKIPVDDSVFVGHFPGEPVYPGVLQLEMMGQHILCLLALRRLGGTQVPTDAIPPSIRAVKIHHAVFLQGVGPGDELGITAGLVESDDFTAVASAQILSPAGICSAAVMEVYFVN